MIFEHHAHRDYLSWS